MWVFGYAKTPCVEDENASQNEGEEPKRGRHDCAVADILDNNAERDP